jgi:hypothetical protein
MRKELLNLLLIAILFASCEKIYQPSIDTVSGLLVVDAQITNEITRNEVHLTRTRGFYDKLSVLEVTGANVSLNEIGSKVVLRGYERAAGHYVFNSVPASGKQYFLRIIIQNDTYESKAVTMPPMPKITNTYTTGITIRYNENSGESTPRTYEKPGREIDADLPLTDSLSHYRFKIRNLIEWTYDAEPGLYPDSYGWFSYQNNERFKLAGPLDMTQPGKITKFPLLTLAYSPLEYFHSSLRTLIATGWIIFIEQYGISKESYEFHELLNKQFAASGSLFDPIQTQIYGNIICKSKPSEIVYGYFDLYTFKEYRYFLNLPPPPLDLTFRQIFKYPDIPFDGEIKAILPSPENPTPDPIQPPDWWEK